MITLSSFESLELIWNQPILVRYVGEHENIEVRIGRFIRLEKGLIPDEHGSAYPVEPPFISVAYRWDKNFSPTEIVDHSIDAILYVRPLNDFRV